MFTAPAFIPWRGRAQPQIHRALVAQGSVGLVCLVEVTVGGVLPPPPWIHHELEDIDAGDDAQLPNQRELLRNHIDVGYVAHVEAVIGC